jgi:hypothetical protein
LQSPAEKAWKCPAPRAAWEPPPLRDDNSQQLSRLTSRES